MTATVIGLSSFVGLVSSMYLVEPTREAIERWHIGLARDLPDFAAPLKQAVDAAAVFVGKGVIEELQTEYARLLVGPAALPCPPWESIYTSPDRQMMQEAHDAVAALYAEAGLAVQQTGVLPDHIGAELHFLARLLERIERGTEQEQNTTLGLADRLLDDHLNRWVGPFTQDLEHAALSALYVTLAQVTRNTVSFLQE